MKAITLLFFALLACFTLSCQTYEVLYVKGVVKLKTSNRALKKDSKFKKQDKLVFTKLSDGLIAMDSRTKSTFLVRPKKNRSNQLVANFRLMPQKMQGRPGEILSGIDLFNYLNEGHNYLVVGEETYLPIHTGEGGYTINQDTFFYLRYDYEGIKVNKKLTASDKGLLLNKQQLFQARFTLKEYHKKIQKNPLIKLPNPKKDTLIDLDRNNLTIQEHVWYALNQEGQQDTISYFTNVELYYFDGKAKKDIPFEAPTVSSGSTVKLRGFMPFNLIFLEDDLVESTISIILNSEMLSQEEKIDHLAAFLEQEFDGKLEEGDLEQWLNDTTENTKK